MTRSGIIVIVLLVYMIKSVMGYNVVKKHHFEDILFNPVKTIEDIMDQ
jgi:hypothetical protein